jgi:RNA recognition motif-containing protein
MAANGVTDAAEQEVTHTEDYAKLIAYGIDEKVASELDIIYQSGLLSHGDLDERALDALKEFPADGGVSVLKEFKESNLEHVSNKSAYLCGVMKTYRHKNKMQSTPGGAEKKPGPDEAKIKEILDRTGYELDYTTGQRKYGGPPPDWDGTQPGAGHEVFCGKIPKEIFEDELIPLFEKCGKIWDMRLMMDPMTGLNRGFCFTTFCDKDGAQEAVKQLDNYEIKPGKRLKVNISVANLRLFVGNIPKSKSKEEIEEEFRKLTENLTDVIIYSSPDDPKKKNRGFAFLEYSTHKDASVAKRRIGNGRTRVFGCDIIVDWADPQEEPDNDVMNKVKVLYVRNLKADVTEEQLKEQFLPYGKIERVKKIKDYGFVHFEERDCAVKAMNALNGTKLGDSEMEVSLAKPPSENKQKEKRRRMQGMFDDFYGYPPGRMGAPRGGRMMRPPFMGYDMGYDYGGYGDFGGGYADDFYDYG